MRGSTLPAASRLLCALLVLLAGSSGAASGANGAGGVTITHLANEGFLFESGETSVLVDALFGDGLRDYPVVPSAVRAELEGARGRFADVDLILVSHEHADHFDPAAVARHLRANPRAAFLSTPQAVAGLRDELGEEAARFDIVETYPDVGASEVHELSGVTVEALNLHHGRGRPTENLGLILRLGGLDLLHVGDTVTEKSDLRPHHRLLATIDVWLLPDWLLGEPAWQQARDRATGDSWLVTMHLAAPTAPPSWFGSAGSLEGRVARIRQALPDAWVPLEPLASRRYPPPD
jgi:L-ascorbate metabolism protein UlaG (beta-lactamase superfamily)